MGEDVYCAQASAQAGEPLAGSAVSAIDRFLVVEHQAAWGPKGVEDSGLPAEVVGQLEQLVRRHPRLRVQLARTTEKGDPGGLRVFFAETGEGPGSLTTLRLPDTSAVGELALDAWLRGDSAAPGTPQDEPLFLVCVHGKRDRCCALYGLPVYRALASVAGERVLQTTHLGGHRFAATLLVLPTGLCYGRVLPGEAEALYQATRRGEFHDLERVRGRTSYTSEAQAAEVALRLSLNDRRIDSLRLLGLSEPSPGMFHVRFAERDGSREHQVEVAREARAPAPASCGAAPKPAQQLVPLKVSARG